MNWAIPKRRGALALVALAVFAIALAGASGPDSKGKKHKKKKPAAVAKVHTEVLFAGNNWDGTADVIKLTAPAKPAKCRKKAKKMKNKAARRKSTSCLSGNCRAITNTVSALAT